MLMRSSSTNGTDNHKPLHAWKSRTGCGLALLVALGISLAGCTNHRFNDADYRPLGESQTVKRNS